MKVTQADLDRVAQPLADDFCRRLCDEKGDRVDTVAVICYLDTERRIADLFGASAFVHALPEVPRALDFGAGVQPLVIAFAPAFDEVGATASFYRNAATWDTWKSLRRKPESEWTVDEMLTLTVLDWLSFFAVSRFPQLMGRGLEDRTPEGMNREASTSERIARKWAADGLSEWIFPGTARPSPSGLLRRRARLCVCREQETLLDVNPFRDLVHRCQTTPVAVRLRESAAADPAEVRRRITPLVVGMIESRWPRYEFRRGAAWEEHRRHMALDPLAEADETVRAALRQRAAKLERMAAAPAA